MIIHRNNPFEKDADAILEGCPLKEDVTEKVVKYVKSNNLTDTAVQRIVELINIKNFHRHLKEGIHEFPLVEAKKVLILVKEPSKDIEKTAETKSVLDDSYYSFEYCSSPSGIPYEELKKRLF